jgi:predicted AlkP superfamily phosphohydrolase/phosphomutase
VVAKHDFADGDDVPGGFIMMGPDVKKNVRLMGFSASVFDITPTILHLYGIPQPPQMKGHVLAQVFDDSHTTPKLSAQNTNQK